MIKKKTTLIFVTYCSEDKIGSALDAIAASCQNGSFDCIVVDNNSSDNTVQVIKSNYKWVKIIENPTNVGYGRGLNLGFDQVTTQYCIFMNPDVILPSESIHKLERFMDANPKAGICAPAILRANGSYQVAGGLPTPVNLLHKIIGLENKTKSNPILPNEPPYKTDWLCGAILFSRVDLMRDIGCFDPRFFLYFEETDLCIRVLKAKYELWAVGEATASHASNSSARKARPDLPIGGCLYEHYYPSRFYYIRKHYGIFSAIMIDGADLLVNGIKDLGRFILRKKNLDNLFMRFNQPVFRSPKNYDS